MIPSSIGDLAQSFVQRRSNTGLNHEMSRLATELTTGLRADIGSAMAGDTRPLASLERSLTGLDAYRTATSEATLLADATQSALGRVTDTVSGLRDMVLAAQGDAVGVDATAAAAKDAFGTVVAMLNTQVSGRSLFAGTATDGPALRSGPEMLASIEALVAGETDPDMVSARIDDYFLHAAGGFMTDDYLGSGTSRAALRLSPDDAVGLPLRADDVALRETLASLAKSAVLAGGATSLDAAGRARIVRQSGTALTDVGGKLVGHQGNVGTAQARIESATTRNAAERSALQEARLSMIGADPYEAASRIEQVEVQLQSLYSMTARMSRLNLTSYL